MAASSVAPDRRGRCAGSPGRTIRARRFLLLAASLAAPALLAAAPLARSAAVVNGGVVRSAPSWAAGLIGDKGGLCTGVLIAPDLVLSAAHCGQRVLKGSLQAVIGQSDILDEKQGARVKITNTTFHPSEDLAVYRLARSVTQAPILISSTDIGPQSGETPFTYFGYGIQSEPHQPQKIDYLLHSTVGLLTKCRGSGAGTILEPKVCLVSQKMGAPCLGDSGGPLVNARNELTGIFIGNSGRIDGRPICAGSDWVTEPMGDKGIRDWVDQMVQSSGA